MNENKLKEIIQDVSSYFGLPSISAAVLADGEEYYASCGMSNIEDSIPADSDTIYAIASSTKAFTAAVICSLAAEGKLNLDGYVKQYIPEFKMKDTFAESNITVRDILCHRSGLPRHDISMYTWDGFEPSKIIEMVGGLTPAYPLKSRWHYQNHMFVLAGELASRVSGQSYKSLVEERILKPLGMHSTYLYGDEISNDNLHLSIPYCGTPSGFIRINRDYSSYPAGDGSIYSSTRDMLKWLEFQLYGNEKILPDNFLREMQNSQMVINPNDGMFDVKLPSISSTSYGLGWFVYEYYGKKLIHHGGTIGGYRSIQMIVPENNIAISILMNGDAMGARDAAGFTVLDELLGISSERNFDKFINIYLPEETTSDTSSDIQNKINIEEKNVICTNINEYAGNYYNEGYGTIHFISASNGEMLLRLNSLGADLILEFVGDDKFLLNIELYGFSFVVTFLRNDAKEIVNVEIPFEPELDSPICFKRVL